MLTGKPNLGECGRFKKFGILLHHLCICLIDSSSYKKFGNPSGNSFNPSKSPCRMDFPEMMSAGCEVSRGPPLFLGLVGIQQVTKSNENGPLSVTGLGLGREECLKLFAA